MKTKNNISIVRSSTSKILARGRSIAIAAAMCAALACLLTGSQFASAGLHPAAPGRAHLGAASSTATNPDYAWTLPGIGKMWWSYIFGAA